MIAPRSAPRRAAWMESAARWIVAAVFAFLFVRLAASRGPLDLSPPRTVLSRGHPASVATEPYLLFLAEVERALPRGAPVLVLGGSWNDELGFLIAIGQLPDHDVARPLSYPDLDEAGPEFVASYRRPLASSRYHVVREFADGALYRRW